MCIRDIEVIFPVDISVPTSATPSKVNWVILFRLSIHLEIYR
jgi:hypothetical protein